MLKKVITVILFVAVWCFLFIDGFQTIQAQCIGGCAGVHNGNSDLMIVKTYTIEPICSGSAKIVTFTLQYANIGTGAATGIVLTDSLSVTGGLIVLVSGGNTITLNLSGLAAGQTGKITYQGLFFGSGYFINNAHISGSAGNESVSVLANNQTQVSGAIDTPLLCPNGALGGGTTYMPVPLPSPYEAAAIPVQIITYIPKSRVIGNNASTYFGFTKIVDDAEKSSEIAMIKENTKGGKLPFVGVEKTRIIGKAALSYVPGMKK